VYTKKGDAAWDDCVAICPVTVLTTVTENREQEVMLSSPVSLAPRMEEQSGCQMRRSLILVIKSRESVSLFVI
jgi:hypothetical protein